MFGNIFDDNKEVRRLAVQNRLMKEYEAPVYRRILEGRRGLRVLDVGCNNGTKTADRFAHPGIKKIIGVEYNGDLVEQARREYGDSWFSFYQCDVEQPDFAPKLRGWMAENDVGAFDLIHLSLVLMHLRNPGTLLGVLRSFLAPDGLLLIVEVNDPAGELSPDPEGLFREFLEILDQDPYSGDRGFGAKIPKLLEEQGYAPAVVENELIRAEGAALEKKESMFDIFFSYVPEDVQLLLEEDPDNRQYLQWKAWLDAKYEPLRRLVLAEEASISLGVHIVTAGRGKDVPFRVQPLTEEYLEEAVKLCGQCVGENLYPKNMLASIMEKPGHFFDLLVTPENTIAGYSYVFLTTLEEAAAAAKLPVEAFPLDAEKKPVIAKIQSIGIAPAYRGHRLTRRLLDLTLERTAAADMAMGTAWKIGDFVPMESNLLRCGFQYLTDAHLLWYDDENLVCPYCKGRCKCSAAVYFKPMKGGESN